MRTTLYYKGPDDERDEDDDPPPATTEQEIGLDRPTEDDDPDWSQRGLDDDGIVKR